MCTFAQCFWEDNDGDNQLCPFREQDTVYILAFAIIMLNTDLHKTDSGSHGGARSGRGGVLSSSKKSRKKMTKQEFINNLRGVEDSEEIPKEFLSGIYESIANHEIALHTLLSAAQQPQQEQRRGGRNNDQGNQHNVHTSKSVTKGVKPAQELLRGMAVHEYPFWVCRDESEMPLEYVKIAFRATWHHFHSIVNTVLDSPQTDPPIRLACLILLRYTIGCSIFLDMSVEREAFVSQLARLKYIMKRERSNHRQYNNPVQTSKKYVMEGRYKTEEWYITLEGFASSRETTMRAIEEVYRHVKTLRMAIQAHSRTTKSMNRVLRKIRNGDMLSQNASRAFICEGDLVKRCRGGRDVTYRFFLFSDQLVYAHRSTQRDFKVHAELPLDVMSLNDPYGTNTTGSNNRTTPNANSNNMASLMFQINHPRKSFWVVAPDMDAKARWIKDISAAVAKFTRT